MAVARSSEPCVSLTVTIVWLHTQIVYARRAAVSPVLDWNCGCRKFLWTLCESDCHNCLTSHTNRVRKACCSLTCSNLAIWSLPNKQLSGCRRLLVQLVPTWSEFLICCTAGPPFQEKQRVVWSLPLQFWIPTSSFLCYFANYCRPPGGNPIAVDKYIYLSMYFIFPKNADKPYLFYFAFYSYFASQAWRYSAIYLLAYWKYINIRCYRSELSC